MKNRSFKIFSLFAVFALIIMIVAACKKSFLDQDNNWSVNGSRSSK